MLIKFRVGMMIIWSGYEDHLDNLLEVRVVLEIGLLKVLMVNFIHVNQIFL